MTGFSRAEVRDHRAGRAPPPQGRAQAGARPDAPALQGRRRRVRYLAAILRIADALDRTHARLVRAVRCSISPKTVDVRIDADGDPELELWAARRKGDLFEELTERKLRFAVDQVREREREEVRRPRRRRAGTGKRCEGGGAACRRSPPRQCLRAPGRLARRQGVARARNSCAAPRRAGQPVAVTRGIFGPARSALRFPHAKTSSLSFGGGGQRCDRLRRL